MSEIERKAISILKNWDNYHVEEIKEDFDTVNNAITTILDLYNKEKEKNKEYEKYYKCEINLLDNYIHKDKIKEKTKNLPHWLTEEEVRGIKFFVNELLEGDK